MDNLSAEVRARAAHYRERADRETDQHKKAAYLHIAKTLDREANALRDEHKARELLRESGAELRAP
jgi:hypothetical protein